MSDRLRPGGDGEVGRHAAEVDADVRVLLAVDGERGGHLHVGAVEVGQLGLPVLVLEVEEEGAQDGRLVERAPGWVVTSAGATWGPGLRRLPLPLAEGTAAGTTGEEAGDGRGDLARIEGAVVVLVGFLEEGLGGLLGLVLADLAVLVGVGLAEQRLGQRGGRAPLGVGRGTETGRGWKARFSTSPSRAASSGFLSSA